MVVGDLCGGRGSNGLWGKVLGMELLRRDLGWNGGWGNFGCAKSGIMMLASRLSTKNFMACYSVFNCRNWLST